jgi:hypothetical protein
VPSLKHVATRLPPVGPHTDILCHNRRRHNNCSHSVLNGDAHVTQTAGLAVGNNKKVLCPFARLLQAYRLLVLGLATVCCNFAVSCPQALFFWHVNSITKAHIFHADNAFFYLYLQTCDFINSKPTDPHWPTCMREYRAKKQLGGGDHVGEKGQGRVKKRKKLRVSVWHGKQGMPSARARVYRTGK